MISRRALIGAAAAVALAASGCTATVEASRATVVNGGPLVVGSTGTAESTVIAEVYAAALAAHGVDAATEHGFGSRDAAITAVQDGTVDLLPDYTGQLLRHFDPRSTDTRADDVYARLRAALPDGLRVLEQAPAENKGALAISRLDVSSDRASIDELLGSSEPPSIGGAAGWESTVPELEAAYGVGFDGFTTTGTDSGSTIKALKDFTIKVGIVSTSDQGLLPERPSTFTVMLTLEVSAQDAECLKECGALRKELQADGDVDSVEYQSQNDAWDAYRTRFADDPEMLEVLRKEAVSAILTVRVKDPAALPGAVARYAPAAGVERIHDIAVMNLAVLQDPKGVFLAQNVVPLLSTDAAGHLAIRVANAVSAKLTTQDLIELNDKVARRHLDPAEVAAEWVTTNGLG